ncbi:MAG: hypothetical protein A3H71_03655 [Candidatus Sungbacteria bacterium RIFCSPLOWO2_02_FULL_48_13b]|uniref:Uncharacterized protein n=1 Tax=Candidatus Sungbacteria bacterium RIFCSPLOWO2_02_FULL_48_13b TaxID=1802283 RepID=A0A1G2LDK8_9BACT|nr:MAG: hypothetical protein A3H71_03655 [Candidatus Sungbacteria bacterium RIFCSPLOWO2_02_FULL_48_13b]
MAVLLLATYLDEIGLSVAVFKNTIEFKIGSKNRCLAQKQPFPPTDNPKSLFSGFCLIGLGQPRKHRRFVKSDLASQPANGSIAL